MAELRLRARSVLRRVLAPGDGAAALQAIDAIGRDAMEEAARLVARLDGLAEDDRAQAVLDRLRRLVEEVHSPPVRRVVGLPRRPVPVEARLRRAEPTLTSLLDELARERDRLARTAVTDRRLEERLASAGGPLDAALLFLSTLGEALEAAGRELAGTDLERAALARGDAAARVVERSRDLLTQAAVLQQAKASLRLLADGRDALVRAIDRTIQVTVSALRVAAAAARSVERGPAMRLDAEALDAADARRIIEGSLAEVRTALRGR